jgi:hypothetical protein
VKRYTVLVTGAATMVALGIGTSRASGQSVTTARPRAAADGAVRTAVPRTPWGAPDLQGTWNGSTITPLERPAEFAGKPVLSPDEVAALEGRARARASAEPQVAAGDPGTYNQIWFDPSSAVVPDHRSSLIVDPPDGKLPFTPDGRTASTRAAQHYGRGARDSHVDFDTGERCLTDGMPIPYWTGYNNNYQIVQTPHYVVIQAEMFHDVRVIPIDGRARLNAPQWLGESRGRWEGDTLVVETINFADKSAYWWATSWRATRPGLRIIERFTRTDPETIDYEFTMEDPLTFTRPWTARFPLTTNQASRGVTKGPLYEYACHEGNYSIVNALKGARAHDTDPPALPGVVQR